MNNTKKSSLLKIAGIMLVVMMFAVCLVSGTMAKYLSSGTTSGGSVDVAKWDIDVNGNDLDTTVTLSSLSWTIEALKDGGDNEAVTTGMADDQKQE